MSLCHLCVQLALGMDREGALVSHPQQGFGSCSSFSSSLCLAVTLASIRSLGHLVAWCGLGPAPDISWACQLDQSVSRAIRALCHLPQLTPAVPGPAHGFSQRWDQPVPALCRQHSPFPIHRCPAGLAEPHGTGEGKHLALLGQSGDCRDATCGLFLIYGQWD